MITTAKDMAQENLEVIRAASLAKMQTSLSEEQERLVALKQINPNIRQEEITFYDKQRNDLTTYIEKTQLQLDAIRLIVVSH
jgi:ATP-dependent helicase HepA